MPDVTGHSSERRKQRERIRRQRRQMPAAERNRCSRQLARHACRDSLVLNSRNIAVYLSADGEMDTRPLIESLWSLGKALYLPVLTTYPDRRLWFSPYHPGKRLVSNRFGILEPRRVHFRRIRPSALDLVLTPLVAFDPQGNRLGMGGGYYDRSFAFLNQRQYWRKPRLLGLAYAFQRLPRIKAETWDVPLNAIVTEQGMIHYGLD